MEQPLSHPTSGDTVPVQPAWTAPNIVESDIKLVTMNNETPGNGDSIFGPGFS